MKRRNFLKGLGLVPFAAKGDWLAEQKAEWEANQEEPVQEMARSFESPPMSASAGGWYISESDFR